MKTKLKFIWKILLNKETGWVFFHLSDKEQHALLNGPSFEKQIFGLGVNKKVLESISKRLEKLK